MKATLRLLLATALLLLAGHTTLTAQQPAPDVTRQLVAPSVPFFVPHWQAALQAGAAYDRGEADFGRLVSPALQLSAAYQFTPVVALRGTLSGLWARNRYAFPQMSYRWNFVQPALELKADLTTLLAGWDPERTVSAYAFLGGGAAYTFGNDDAEQAAHNPHYAFQKLWTGHRWNPVVRGGLGTEISINDDVAVTVEANANMLPDHFNSKVGRHDNRDWHFNALVGLKVNLGPTHGRTQSAYRELVTPAPQPAPVEYERDTITMVQYIQFEINKSVLRPSELPKLDRLVEFLKQYPTTHLELAGYADKETGTPEINQRLSEERAQAVSRYLIDHGIDYLRIKKYAHGDRVQPFQIPEDNRVTICLVTDKVILTRPKQ